MSEPLAAGMPATDAGSAGRPSISESRALALLAMALGTLYFGLFNHDFTYDGLTYAAQVEQGGPLFHPNHLLPNALFEMVWKAVQALGLVQVRAAWWMQGVNALAGIATAVCLARALVPTADVVHAALLALLYGVGFAAWNAAQEPEVHALPALCVAASLALLWRSPVLGWGRISALSLLGVLAVLFLQQYVFWYPALLLLVGLHADVPARRAKLAFLVLAVPLACLTAYLAIGTALGMRSDRSHLLAWLLGYGWQGEGGVAGFHAGTTLIARLGGIVLGLGNLVYAYELLLVPWLLVPAVLGLMLLAWAGVQACRAGLVAMETRRRLGVIAIYGLVNLLFAGWWEPRDIEFLFPAWLALVAMLGLGARALPVRIMATAPVVVFVVNLLAAFGPQRDWPLRYRIAERLADREHLGANDVLITEELNTVAWLAYFRGVDVRFEPGAVSAAMHAQRSVADVRSAIDAALMSGKRVYTMELDEHGRLYRLATAFGWLGRSGFDGGVERDLGQLYAGLVLRPTGVVGVRRLQAPIPIPSSPAAEGAR